MSSRNIRRLAKEKEEREQRERDRNKEEENEDNDKENEDPAEEFSPHVVHMNPAYEGLDVSSASESELSALSELPYQDEAAAVIPEEDKYGAKKKTYTAAENERKEKKDKKKKRKNKNFRKQDEMDEVEWSLREVNRVLGTPPAVGPEEIEDPRVAREKRLFSIRPNQINVNYELAKVFGEKDRLKKARTGTRRMRHEIGLSPDVHPFRVKGLTMTRYKTEGDIKFFRFEHTPDYTKRCKALVTQLKSMLFGQGHFENNLHSENCVEALLENCDFLYFVEEHKGGNQALEQAIYFMQSVGEPSFNFVDGKTRLLYQFVENRPFHIAILKYLHVLTNIACHRTALELAKVLLNLDPSDPLAVIFIIDTLAIRSREYQWLLDLINYWEPKRQVERLFHMRYSQALAMFQIACTKKDYAAVDEAKLALVKAIMNFPQIAMKIMEFSKVAIPQNIRDHEIFVQPPGVAVSNDLEQLMSLYAWFIAPRWREPHVWNWLMDVFVDLTDLYDRTPELKEEIIQYAILRERLFRKMPTQMKRHLYAIKPMAKYITDGRMPVIAPSVSFNPFPCEGTGTDTYRYFSDWMLQFSTAPNAFMALIRGIYPEMYQLGLNSMSEMLARMDGTEICTAYGTYSVVGPNVHNQPGFVGPRTYRVVFQRHRLAVLEPDEPEEREEPEPNQMEPAVGEPGPVQPERLLLNGSLEDSDDDELPLLNRLNLNGGNPNEAEDLDQSDRELDNPEH